ncbi:hypothetical protein ALC53_06291 [Atta colombica]|uniref:Uncharacterized protein n=1 Tax=Atta colombica TaxID=520822 RepID=A0A195BEK9_9HYME|nr:hypothetical protein ALC53_06291 [Atta colombica]
MKRERQQTGGPARRRRGRFAKHSGAWKTVEGTEERKTVAKLLQFFQTAAQPSPHNSRAAIGSSPPPPPRGDITTQFRSHGSFALRLFLCRLALSSANSEIKLRRSEIRIASNMQKCARILPQCSFDRILENFEHRIMPKCSHSEADAGLAALRILAGSHSSSTMFSVSLVDSRDFVC